MARFDSKLRFLPAAWRPHRALLWPLLAAVAMHGSLLAAAWTQRPSVAALGKLASAAPPLRVSLLKLKSLHQQSVMPQTEPDAEQQPTAADSPLLRSKEVAMKPSTGGEAASRELVLPNWQALQQGEFEIRSPDAALPQAGLRLMVFVELDRSGRPLDVEFGPLDRRETEVQPFLEAAADGLKAGTFPSTASTQSAANTLICVEIRFADQVPIQLRYWGAASITAKQCLAS